MGVGPVPARGDRADSKPHDAHPFGGAPRDVGREAPKQHDRRATWPDLLAGGLGGRATHKPPEAPLEHAVTILHALLGVLLFLAFCAAFAGCFGLYNLFLSDSDIRWWAHGVVWVSSVVSLAVVIAIVDSTGVMNRRRGYEVGVSFPQPAPTSTVKLDLPGAPTSEQCAKAVRDGQAAGSISPHAVIVAACS